MSNIYNLEPQAVGLIKLTTTFGELEVELFTKQCPKATQNFIQLCLDGFYKQTIFNRVEKDFIAVGGIPEHFEEIDETQLDRFPDEFHSRLKFSRRGLLATANEGKHENGSKFFFTLGPTPELQDKHTIFGRLKGDSIYCLVDLNECPVDDDYRPISEKKILDIQVVENPFPELRARKIQFSHAILDKNKPGQDDIEYDPLLKPRTKPSKKLSFGYDDDDDDDSGNEAGHESTQDGADSQEDGKHSTTVQVSEQEQVAKVVECDDKEASDGSDSSGSSLDEKEKKLHKIRAQIQSLKEQIEKGGEIQTLKERREASKRDHPQTDDLNEVVPTQKKTKLREKETIEMVASFRNKLREVDKLKSDANRHSEKVEQVVNSDLDLDEAELDRVDGLDWMSHKFEPVEEDEARLAKDANTKDDLWYLGIDEVPEPSHRERDRSRDRKSKHSHRQSREGSSSRSHHRDRNDGREKHRSSHSRHRR